MKFSEMQTFNHVIQPEKYDLQEDIELKGNWNRNFFNKNNPIVLELGCGKGEYSVSLAQKYPNKNFIGVDIKGSRIWNGAKSSLNKQIDNIGFLRIMIENIDRCFDQDEVDEIWITFPDPQIKRKRQSKRLTHPNFLRKYNKLLSKEAVIHLKTDSQFLYGYTLGIIESESHELIDCTNDLYNALQTREDLNIQTYYEKIFLEQGKPITYIKFRLKY